MEKNYQKRAGEIDLILYDKKRKMVIFVEVKSGHKSDFDVFTNAINEKKIKKITKVAAEYIENLDISYEDIRFDAVFIERNDTGKIRQLKNVIRLN